ncbi:MAG: tetratricopeptide repeat protein, partial [Cyanobacteria bacterium J06558_2]
MSINRNSSTLIPLEKNPQLKNSPPRKSLALVPSNQNLDQLTPQQNSAVARIYAEQAKIYFQEQNWLQAIAACKNALEHDPQNADAYKILGNVLKVQGKKAEALGVYAKALAINPNSATIYANLGSFHAEQKNWQQALDYFQNAVILDPNLAGAYRSLAQIWEELGNSEQALECFCRAVDLEPERLTPQEYFSFGQELYQQGKLQEASIFYVHGVKQNPQAEAELAQLVKIFEELEDWQQAVIYYQQLISLTDDDLEFSNSSAQQKPIKNLLSRSQVKSQSQANLNHGKPQGIKQAKLNSATLTKIQHKLASKSREINFPQAKALASSNDTSANPAPEATAELAIKPESPASDSATSWNNLGSLYAQKQQWTEAINCYQEALKLDPKMAKTYRNLARVYHQTGKEAQSNLCWYHAFNLKPEQVKPQEHFNLARKLLQQQEIDKAIVCLQRTVQLQPDFSRAHLILGKLFEQQGKSTAAQACYEKVKL